MGCETRYLCTWLPLMNRLIEINSLQVLCRNQMRLGDMEDGGKEVCLDEKYKPKYPCLVYSFGSNLQFNFEVSVLKQFNCIVHTFDPVTSVRKENIPNGINFHLIGLSNESITTAEGWKMLTLSSIRKMLNHADSVIDILKIDIEGGEWTRRGRMDCSSRNASIRSTQICEATLYRGTFWQDKPEPSTQSNLCFLERSVESFDGTV